MMSLNLSFVVTLRYLNSQNNDHFETNLSIHLWLADKNRVELYDGNRMNKILITNKELYEQVLCSREAFFRLDFSASLSAFY